VTLFPKQITAALLSDSKQVLLMILLPHLFNAQIVNKSQQIQAEQIVLSHLFNNAQTQRKDMQVKQIIMHKSKERIYGLKRKLLQSTVR
jgi:bifunctional DNase/RNase